MAGPWITDAELKQLVANALKKDVAQLSAYWTTFVTQANADAAADITEILMGKGFTAAQIDAWDNRVTNNRDIGLYHALVKGGALAEYDQTTVDKLDRRKRLEAAVTIMINGAAVAPDNANSAAAAGAAGGVIDDAEYRVNKATGLWRNRE